MARDRNILWQEEKRPKNEDIHHFLEDFFGDVAEIRFDAGTAHWHCALPGKPSYHLKRLAQKEIARGGQAALNEYRWIEVIALDDCGMVTTRDQDAFVNAIADGLAAAMTSWF